MDKKVIKQKKYHTHIGALVTLTSGKQFRSILTRTAFNEKVIEIITSGGLIMNTSVYGYKNKSKNLVALRDISVYVRNVETVHDQELTLEIMEEPKKEK